MNRKKEVLENSEKITRILIVDDHSVVRKGLTQLINEEPDLVVYAEAENADRALNAIERHQIDLAIVDISLDGLSGLKLTERINTSYPNLPVLILSVHDELSYCKRAFRAGARGFLVKNEAAKKIITAIHQVLSGKIYISEKMAAKMTRLGLSNRRDIFDPNQATTSNPA